MRTITTIGLDIAKSVFQVHGVDAVGQVVIRRQLKRRYAHKKHKAILSTFRETGTMRTTYRLAAAKF